MLFNTLSISPYAQIRVRSLETLNGEIFREFRHDLNISPNPSEHRPITFIHGADVACGADLIAFIQSRQNGIEGGGGSEKKNVSYFDNFQLIVCYLNGKLAWSHDFIDEKADNLADVQISDDGNSILTRLDGKTTLFRSVHGGL